MLSNCTMSLPVSHISQKRARSVEVDPLLLLSTLSMIEQKILSSSSDPRHELEEDDADNIATLVEQPTTSSRGFRARSPSKSYRDWLLQGTPEAFLAGYEKKKRIDILATTTKKNIGRRCNANETNVVTPPATPTESSSDKLLFQKTLETTGAKRQNNESDDIDTFSSSASSADDHEYQWCYVDCIIPLKD